MGIVEKLKHDCPLSLKYVYIYIFLKRQIIIIYFAMNDGRRCGGYNGTNPRESWSPICCVSPDSFLSPIILVE